jgi:ParB family chromosome partitioning protein
MSETKSTYTKGTLYEINVEDLQTDPNQPRKFVDQEPLQDLADSIKTQGVLQPVLFRVDQDGKLFIAAGERRLQAVKIVGLETIPAILTDGNPNEIALIENLFREDLTAMEHAEALNRMKVERNYTQEQLGVFVRKAKSTVSEILSLVKLPQKIKDECRNDPSVSRQLLIEIVRKKKREKGMLTAYKKYKDRILSPRKTRGPKVKRTFETRFTSKFDRMKTFMTGIDLGKLDASNRKDLSSLVENLKKAADDFLKSIKKAPAYVKETKPVAKPKPKKETPKKISVKTVTKTKAKKS